MIGKVSFIYVVSLLGLSCGQVVPPGLSDPLTKMAERMTKVPRTSGVEGKLREQAKSKIAGSFLRCVLDSFPDTANAHISAGARMMNR